MQFNILLTMLTLLIHMKRALSIITYIPIITRRLSLSVFNSI